MPASEKLPAAADLAHHVNAKSTSRHPSPLKDIIQYMGYDGMISLAGGLPHPSLFPLQACQFTCLAPTAPILIDTDRPSHDLVSVGLTRGSPQTLQTSQTPTTIDITPFLQYGSGAGNKQLLDLARELTDRVHRPPYQYECLLHPGNTNAWSKVVDLLCEPGDVILTEEFTYPSAQALWIPLGIQAVPVRADGEGMSAADLEAVLAGWEASGRPEKRPHVLYLVSVGSNPTGLSIGRQRRQEIYDVCVQYDVILVEDDPYYFLQYPSYDLAQPPRALPTEPAPAFLASLTPSFLSLDTQGRVVRLESFSKTIFPGLRLGYFVANPLFIERLLRATEVETQDPAGLSQAFLLALMQTWQVDGYLDWMQNIRAQYHTRRDWLINSIATHFTLAPSPSSPGSYTASLPSATGELQPVFSFVAPIAGMFLWAKFYFANVQRFKEMAATDCEDPEQAFATELWQAWAKELVLLTPGSYYHPWQGKDKQTTSARGADPSTAYFRLAFSTATEDQLGQGIERLARVLRRYI